MKVDDIDEGQDRRKDDRWHVGKEIPIALLFMMGVQTAGGIWWAATLTAKMDDLSFQVAAINADKYTKTDAQKDGALYSQKMSELERRIDKLEPANFRR